MSDMIAPAFNEDMEMQCIHCERFFAARYLRWHFSHRRPAKGCIGKSLLRCRACGLMTLVCWALSPSSEPFGPDWVKRKVEESERGRR